MLRLIRIDGSRESNIGADDLLVMPPVGDLPLFLVAIVMFATDNTCHLLSCFVISILTEFYV